MYTIRLIGKSGNVFVRGERERDQNKAFDIARALAHVYSTVEVIHNGRTIGVARNSGKSLISLMA